MLFSHTGKGGMTCAIEQHPGRGHGTRPRHIEDGTPAECCVAGPGSCSPRRGRLVRKDIVMRLALRKRFACPACQIACSEGWSDSHWQGSRNYMGVFKSSVKNAGRPRENTEGFGGGGGDGGATLGGARTFVWGAIGLLWGGSDWAVALLRLAFGDIGFLAMRFRVTKGLIAENQSTDDCLDWHQLGAGGRGGQSYCLQTPTKHLEANCYFYEIIRIRFCNPASLPVSRARSASQPLQGRFDARPSPSRQPVIDRKSVV